MEMFQQLHPISHHITHIDKDEGNIKHKSKEQFVTCMNPMKSGKNKDKVDSHKQMGLHE
jgi:hypothetical protein